MITKEETKGAWSTLTNAFASPNENKVLLIIVAIVGFTTVLIIKIAKIRIWQPKPTMRRQTRRAPMRKTRRKRRR
jgi:hypothetical protein